MQVFGPCRRAKAQTVALEILAQKKIRLTAERTYPTPVGVLVFA